MILKRIFRYCYRYTIGSCLTRISRYKNLRKRSAPLAIRYLKSAYETGILPGATLTKIAVCYFLIDENTKVVDFARRALQYSPAASYPRHVSAYAYFEEGQYAEAIGEYEKIAPRKRNPAMLQELGLAHFELENYEQALKFLEEAESEAMRDPMEFNELLFEVRFTTAAVYFEMDDYQQSLDIYEKLSKLNPENFDVQYGVAISLGGLGRYQEALSLLEETLSRDDANKASYLYSMGFTYEKLGKTDSAMKMYRTSLEADPNDEETIEQLSRLLYERGDYSELLHLNQSQLESGDASPVLFTRIGYALLGLKRYSDAIELLEKANTTGDLETMGCYCLAACYFSIGKKEQAWKLHELLKDTDPELANKLSAEFEEIEKDSANEGDAADLNQETE